MADDEPKPGPKGEKHRVRPDETVVVRGSKVRNTTATSIEVQVDGDGVVTVTDCCLEEQGK